MSKCEYVYNSKDGYASAHKNVSKYKQRDKGMHK